MHKKIIIIKRSAKYFGGLEKYTNTIIDSILKKNDKILLLTDKEITNKDYEVKHLNISSKLSFQKVLEFDKKAERFLKNYKKVDIILNLDRSSYQTHIRAGNGSHLNFLKNRRKFENFFKNLSFSINPLHRAILNIEKKSFESKFLKKLITNSNMVRNEILENFKIDSKKVTTVHNGVEWKNFENHFLDFDEKFFKQQNFSKEKFHFLFIGNDYKRKGLKILIEALSLLKEKDFHLTVIGKEKFLEKFKKFANSKRILNKISFFGFQKNILNFLKMADVLVLPTFYDPFSNVVLEALAMGVFVVTSKNNGASEVITSKNGLIINDLQNIEETRELLKQAMVFKKTTKSAKMVRETVKNLDFSNQIDKFLEKIYE